jgi:tRNA modification GTPase
VRGALAAAVRERLPEEAGEGLLSPRQAELAEAAAAELKSAPLTEPELLAESLRWAAARMAEMAGEVSEEAVLDRLFATFCVGK